MPKIQNNRYAAKFEQVEKKSKSDVFNEDITLILNKFIAEQEANLKEIEGHKKEATEKIDLALNEAIGKIMKDSTPVSKIRRSVNWLDSCKRETNLVWPANQSYENPIVSFFCDDFSACAYFGSKDKQGNFMSEIKANAVNFDPDQVRKV